MTPDQALFNAVVLQRDAAINAVAQSQASITILTLRVQELEEAAKAAAATAPE